MAMIVGGFIMPHEPGVFLAPQERWSVETTRLRSHYDAIGARIGELGATTVIVIGADHYVLFGPGCLPSYLIGIGEVSGPYERFPGIEQGDIPNNPVLAHHIVRSGHALGFDWAVAKTLRVDHSIGIPARLCALPNPSVRAVVPVYLASGVEPLLPMARCYQLGRQIRDAVQTWDADERVVVIGSGGISHWVGLAQMGQVNATFDKWVIDCFVSGDAAALIGRSDAEVLAQGGNGAWEIRSFVCLMGAMPGCTGRLLAYESDPQWVTGMGFAELLAQPAPVDNEEYA
ncbi:hypothetical protein O4H66_26080 [Comamonadaceae bacterium G21597-S1]|nr:hypothetical protein [Comamonadaceae bacterium G21597-S1]